MAQYSRKLKKGIRWYYKFDLDNETYFSKCIYLSKTEARKAEHTRYEEVSTQARNPQKEPVLSLLQAINERLDFVQIKKSNDHYKDRAGAVTGIENRLAALAEQDISRN